MTPAHEVACAVAGLILFGLLATVSAAGPPQVALLLGHHPVPGGIAVVRLQVEGDGEPQARYGRTPILVIKSDGVWRGIVGISLDTPLGNYVVTATSSTGETSTSGFSVTPYEYPLKSSGRPEVIPHPLILPDTWTGKLLTSFPFVLPVESTRIERFGTLYTNGNDVLPVQSAILHVSGDSEVRAPGRGLIVELFEYGEANFFVTIDHGMGLHSALGPIRKPRRKVGDIAERGEVLAEFEPGNSISAQLHWKAALNGVNVDPLLLTRITP